MAVNRLRDHSPIVQSPTPSERNRPVRTPERQEIIGGGEALLNTEIDLKYNWPVVLGFPENGHVYFLSISVFPRNLDDGSEHVVPGTFSGEGYLPPPLPLREVTPEEVLLVKAGLDSDAVKRALETIESGTMTGDLVKISTQAESAKAVFMEDFFDAIKDRLESKR